MRNFIFRKVLYKKWLNSGMLFAIILLVGIVCANPLYRAAVGQKMVCTNLDNTYDRLKENPGYVSASGPYVYGKENAITSRNFDDISKMSETLEKMIQMPVISRFKFNSLAKSPSIGQYVRDGGSNDDADQLAVGCIEQLDKHVKISLGKLYSDKRNADGSYDCVMTHTVMQKALFSIGEKITLPGYVDKDGSPLVVKLVGVIAEKDTRDGFWTKPAHKFEQQCFIAPNLLKNICSQLKEPPKMSAEAGLLFDYHKMKSTDVSSIYDSVCTLSTNNSFNNDIKVKISMLSSFENYYRDSGKTSSAMWMLQMPMMVLLVAFIFMTSRQIFETEKNEISMLASRGASRLKIVLLYLMQSSFLSLIGMIVGLALAYFICKMIGFSNAFMEFVSRGNLMISYNLETFLYALGAGVVSIAFVTLPVIQYSKIGIVELKRKKKKNNSPIWYRFYFDVILLIVSIYLFWNMGGQKEQLVLKVLGGTPIDPMFYLIAPLFMLGMGMFCFRLLHWIIILVYKIGKKKWGPSSYTAFLYLIREGKCQWFISVFIMLTIAMGIFNSNFARTINQNVQQRAKYNMGADLVMQEQWADNSAEFAYGTADTLIYFEPDYEKYDTLKKAGVKNIAKVYNDNNALLTGNFGTCKVQLMGIETKNFGETAKLEDGITKIHWYNYLNTLAKNDQGVIISRNLADTYKLKVGSEISIERTNSLDKSMGKLKGKVCGIVDAFPGFEKYTTINAQTGNVKQVENYLVVANFSQVDASFTSSPYEIWMNTDGNSKKVYDFVKKKNIDVNFIKDIDTTIAEQKNDPFYQVTNGLLTITFVVVLVLSIVGFLIYWIISIRQRELLFGVYRAMGMSMKGVLRILTVEHIFSSICSIIIGVGIGLLTTKLFLSLVSLPYLPEKHVIGLHVVSSPFDMIRLGICVAVMLVVCFFVLGNILKKMKISQVLKLGED